ncbi:MULTISPECIES: hypothetical protein [Chromobacterium]|uniref:Phage coat protein n=1 Tax=Chromobacterium rhizoryzae TaxID=1778675 RepID=A0AAD0RRT7_9NEIS|nr:MULTISPECIES: hypothetical protein [Chromobacterium]AXT46653.1 hypothetical protein D1345_10820 [Chromobacterium rhizoryzae]
MKHLTVVRKFGSRLSLVVLGASASAAAMADGVTLPDMAAALNTTGAAVMSNANASATAVTPYVLGVAAIVLVYAIAKKLFKKIA